VSGRHGSVSVRVTRPEARVALIEATALGYDETIVVMAGEHTLTVTAFDGIDAEPRVHVVKKPSDWDMTPDSDPPTSADDQGLLIRLWEVLG